jgi:hypothetical protein
MTKKTTAKKAEIMHIERESLPSNSSSTAITNVLSAIERAATNPDVDIAKMQQLLDIQERVMAKQAEMSFNAAMGRLQQHLPTIKHDAKLVHRNKATGKDEVISTYARYETIDRQIRKLYTKEGFSLSFSSRRNQDGSTTYLAKLSHADGHSQMAEMVLPADAGGAKNAIQAIASTVSYAKRYLVAMHFNLVTEGEDDDGKEAAADPAKKQSKFDQRAEAAANPHDRTIDTSSVRVETTNQADYSPELAELAEEGGDDIWDGRTVITGEHKKVERDFESPAQACAYLQKVMSSHKTKAARLNLIALNTTLTRHMIRLKQMSAITALHNLADSGEAGVSEVA